MTNKELCDKAVEVAKAKTVYAYGGLGYHGTPTQKSRVLRAYPKENNKAKIKLADEDTWMFDCVGFIKALCNGFNFLKNKPSGVEYNYGGASFPTSGPLSAKYGAAAFFNEYCENISADFKSIKPGEAVWMRGSIKDGGDSHIGIYLGGAMVVECTPRWNDGVQLTACLNIADVAGYNGRYWDYHGTIPCIDYSEVEKKEQPKEQPKEQYHIATKGQGLAKIGALYGVPTKEMKALNPNVKPPLYIVKVGQKIRIK